MNPSPFPFKHIAIIGLGLIGGSVAQAVKRHVPSCVITGCNANSASIQKALQMGIIDHGTTDPVQAVALADLILLGTPLGVYKTLLETIAPHIKPGTVITDVGSVKTYVVETALLSLPTAHLPFFVPGHPIAGSEKSGVEASSATLYYKKRVILTPLSSTKPKALHEVKAMWETFGAEVEFIEPEYHDILYAENSHLVQFAAYSFLSSMLGLGTKALQHASHTSDEVFRSFIRLGGSNPRMWSDIFLCNHRALLQALERLQYHLASLSKDINQEHTSRLKQRFANAKNKRKELKDNVTADISPIIMEEGKVYTLLFPYLIACAIMETVSDVSYAGSGLRDVTSILISRGRVSPELMLEEKARLTEALGAIGQKLGSLGHLVESGQAKALVTALEDSVTLHRQFLG